MRAVERARHGCVGVAPERRAALDDPAVALADDAVLAGAQAEVVRVEALAEVRADARRFCCDDAVRVVGAGDGIDGVRADLDGVAHADEDAADNPNDAG